MIDVAAETIGSLIGDIYQTAMDPAAWPETMRSIRDLLGGNRSCMTRVGVTGGSYSAVASDDMPADMHKLIEDIAKTPTPYLKRLQELTPGSVYTEGTLLDPAWLRSSALWNEWMKPLDMHDGLGIKVREADGSLLFLAVHRSSRRADFGAQDIALLKLVTPHILRAVELNRSLAGSVGALSTLAGIAVAALVVTPDLQLGDINGPAEMLVGRSDSPLQLRNGLVFVTERDQADFARLVADACSVYASALPGRGGDLILRDGDGRPAWMATVMPAVGIGAHALFGWGRALVLIRELSLALPSDFDRTLCAAFGLAPAEARLAVALASGLSLKDAAEMRGVRLSTARSYLEGIFRKTGTRQQSQLVALLRALQPLLGRS